MVLARLPLCAWVMLLFSARWVYCTNFPPVSEPIPVPPQPSDSRDVVPENIQSKIESTNFKPAERIPGSSPVTESATQKPASELVLSDDKNDDWFPLSGTIGPVATPRPDGERGDLLQPRDRNVRFPLPPVRDNSQKQQSPNIWIISRGISGQYTEQQWIPVDSPLPRESREFRNFPPVLYPSQNVPNIFPVFPPPVKPEFLLLTRGKSQAAPVSQVWIPPSVSPDVTPPLSVPPNSPPVIENPPPTIVLIQNRTFPFAVQPPLVDIRAPPSVGEKSSLFPPLQYVPKQITFPVPKSFAPPNTPVDETPATKPPAEETPESSEVSTLTPTTPKQVALPPSLPEPPSPPQPPSFSSPPLPPPYFFFPSQDKSIQAFLPVLVPSTPMKWGPQQTNRSLFPPITNPVTAFGSQFPRTFPSFQGKTSVPLQRQNFWIPGSTSFPPQFPQQKIWYPVPLSLSTPKTLSTLPNNEGTESSPSQTMGFNRIPPPSSDFWILRGTRGPQNVNEALLPAVPPGELFPKPKISVPVTKEVLPQTYYQGVVPVFPSVPRSFTAFPQRVNSSRTFGPRNVPSYKYGPDAFSQIRNFPLPLPLVTYPVLPQIRQSVPMPPARDNKNCTSPNTQNRNFMPPPPAFYVQAPAPVYLPLPPRQSPYTLVPARPFIPDVPRVVVEPSPAVDSDGKSSTLTDTPTIQESENEKQDDPEPAFVPEVLPPPPEVSAVDNVVIAPIFPFVKQPVVLPKSTAVNEGTKRPPYFFGYDQRDAQGALQHRREEATPDGTIKGSYGYRDANGVYRKIDYTSGKDGYHAVVATNESGMTSQGSSDDVVKNNNNSFTSSSPEKGTPESET